MAALPLPFRLEYRLFLFLAWLLCLGLPVLCWMGVVRVSILVVFWNSVGERSAFHCWVLCWLWVYFIMLCPLYTQFGESFFYQKWMLNFIKCSSYAHWDDHVFCFFILLIYAFPFFDSYSSQDGLSCAALMNSSQLSVVLLHRDLFVRHATVGLCMAPLRGPDEGSVFSQLLRQKSNIASGVLALKTASRKWCMWLWFIIHWQKAMPNFKGKGGWFL